MSQPTVHQAHEELANDNVHVSIHRKPSCRIEMTIKASRPIIETAKHNAIKLVNKEVVLPGFRKGKAPEEMILKKFPNDVQKEIHKCLADAAFVEAQKLANIPILNRNSQINFDLKNISTENAELFFSFETEPTVPSVDPKQFQPKPVERKPITEVEIEEAVRQMRFFFADWTPVVDRPIQKGDYILIDVDTIEGEKPQKVFSQVRFEVSPDRMAQWMSNLVIGAKVNDVLEGISEPDANATEAEKQEFAPKKVRITIYKVEEARLPEVDDKFAQKVGSSNVEEMRSSILTMLNNQADEKEQEDLRQQVIDFLIKDYSLDLPESIVVAEKEFRHKEMMKNAKYRREWEKMSPEEKTAAAEKMALECRNSVALFYLSRQIVNDAKIPVTHQEIQDEAIATIRGQTSEPIEVSKIPREFFALALSKIILAKAQDYIIRTQKESAA